MTIKQDLAVFGVMALIFVVCSFAMIAAHEALSRYPVVTYAFIAIYGLSALGWPIFFVRSVWKAIGLAFRSGRTRI